MLYTKDVIIRKLKILYNYYPDLDMLITTHIKLLQLGLIRPSDPMPLEIYNLLFNHIIQIPRPIILEN